MEGQGAPENSQETVQDIRGSVDQGDQVALDHQDGQVRVLEEAHGQHAQEARGGYCEAGCIH